jgi:hypothetical protein
MRRRCSLHLTSFTRNGELGHTAGRSIVDRLVLIVSLFVDRTLKTDSFLYGCFVASINRVPKMDRLLHYISGSRSHKRHGL